MDIEAILKQLRAQRDQIDASIAAIQHLEAGKSRGPGRPPKWLAAVKANVKAGARTGVSTAARPRARKQTATRKEAAE